MTEHKHEAMVSAAETQHVPAHSKQLVAPATKTVPASRTPLLAAPIVALRRFPRRYIVHTVMAIGMPLALGLSSIAPAPVAAQQASEVVTEADKEPVGNPPLPESEEIPVPLSITSPDEATAPFVVPATVQPDVTALLRTGPGEGYNSLATLPSGSDVSVTGRYGEWLQVTTPEFHRGWVPTEEVTIPEQALRMVFEVQPASEEGKGENSTAPSELAPASPNRQPTQPVEPAADEDANPAAPVAEPGQVPAATVSTIPASGDVAGRSLNFIGYPYVWGAAGPGAFDCSGFIVYLYSQVGVYFPHYAASQFSTAYGAPINSIEDLAPGDVVFFAGTSGPGISHVGLALGGGRFIHAMSPGYGVQVSSLYSGYWASHYAGAIRPYR